MNVVSGTETINMRCTENAFLDAQRLGFGDEVVVVVVLRNYRGDWIPRIDRIELQ